MVPHGDSTCAAQKLPHDTLFLPPTGPFGFVAGSAGTHGTGKTEGRVTTEDRKGTSSYSYAPPKNSFASPPKRPPQPHPTPSPSRLRKGKEDEEEKTNTVRSLEKGSMDARFRLRQ